MSEIYIMVVEDNSGDRQIVRDSAEFYELEFDRKVKIEFCDNVPDAIARINGSFDGAILDMKLQNDEEGGNKILEAIENSTFRVPVIFVTAYPDLVDNSNLVLRSRPRGEGKYSDDFDAFFDFYHTGITKIMGRRGKIEEALGKVFINCLMPKPQRDTWIGYGQKDPVKTEKALLRFTLNHLMQMLDDDDELSFPEEAYLYPPVQQGFKTGSIVKEKGADSFSVILNPACDLVVRSSGQIKTDRLLLVEIDGHNKVYDHILKKLSTSEEKEEKLRLFFCNRYSPYYHWLPETTFFAGGFLNFRKLSTMSPKECLKKFERPKVQVSSHFIKDILSRFSSYYARQGQPDIECSDIVKNILSS